MPQPTPGLALEYVPCAGGARLVRLFGDTPCPVLPAHVDGLPLAELGDYCFAQEMRETAAIRIRLWHVIQRSLRTLSQMTTSALTIRMIIAARITS